MIPALENAIALIVCSCFGPEFSQYENYFLSETRKESHEALSFMNNMEQYFVAQLLLGWYYLRMGRLTEGYVTAVSKYSRVL